ncbi:Bgt-51534 [Blumeria graminis f. sp. tritici]|uniref:Bgt-51534 n=1 Tax=Blumeria graminis f. sp. tritici TaxID=62690 RepID=A0A9X9LAP6_BLUGR|nr:Bgt-51534 [Blumeria graminis f. sp. tritici]
MKPLIVCNSPRHNHNSNSSVGCLFSIIFVFFRPIGYVGIK